MTSLHAQRKALPRRPARSKPEAARRSTVAPARRIKRAREPAPAGDSAVSYVLRSRQVLVPNTSKPIIVVPTSIAMPAGPSYNTEKEPEDIPSRQTLTCAQMGLKHYNNINQGGEHELVKPVESNAFFFNGVWVHANFLAKRIDATSCDELVPKYFFAELKSDYEGFSCVSCVKLDSGVPRKLGGCGVCPRQIMHPVDGGYQNAQPFNDSATAGRCVFITF